MTKQVVFAENAPRAAGPYSHAIIANGMVYTAGQVGIVLAEGKMIEGGIREQTEQVLKNLRTVLEAAGSSLDKVVKISVFLANMDDFAEMNTIYATFFPDAPPARTTIQAGRLPIGALVEIESIAVL